MDEIALSFPPAAVELSAASGAGDNLTPIKLTAYTGGVMTDHAVKRGPSAFRRVVIDLDGITMEAGFPLHLDHDSTKVVGHATEISVINGALVVAGVISGTGTAALEVENNLRRGFPYQASPTTIVDQAEVIEAGRQVTVNGQTYTGPLAVVRKARIREVSFVSMGADANTRAAIAAKHQGNRMDANDTAFETWAASNGHDLSAADDAGRTELRSQFDRTAGGDGSQRASVSAASPSEVRDVLGDRPELVAKAIRQGASLRTVEAMLAEDEARERAISNILDGEDALLEQAARERWSENQARTALARAVRDRPQATRSASAPRTYGTGRKLRGDNVDAVLAAAVCRDINLGDEHIAKHFDEATIEAAEQFSGIGLKGLARACVNLDRHHRDALSHLPDAELSAAFSTSRLASVIDNVADKALLAVYDTQDIMAFQISDVSSVQDFKVRSRYRLLPSNIFEKVGVDGELPSGQADDDKYDIAADTYGQLMKISRRDVINDDADILRSMPQAIGQAAMAAIDYEAFTKLNGNVGSDGATFFSVANDNYIEGADTVFGFTGYEKARQKLRKQKAGASKKDSEKIPLNLRPRFIVVPTELEMDATILMGSEMLNLSTGTNATIREGSMNPLRNNARVVSVPHLSDTDITGNSATAFYVFADPRIAPAMELTFLRGRQRPTFQRVAPPVEYPEAVFFRSYIDFGVELQDRKGAIKSKGAA